MPEAVELCAHCGDEVPPEQARSTRYTLEHLTIDQVGAYEAIMDTSAVPALLCASCLNPILSQINATLHAAANLKPVVDNG